MKRILIYGAGAIGRGYLAPIFSNLGYDISFVDNNKKLICELKKRNSYKTAFSNGLTYEIVDVKYSNAFLLGEEDSSLNDYDLVFSCVGPNNIPKIAHKLKNVQRIITFENEYDSIRKIKEISGNNRVYFGIPDVITSNEAPRKLIELDNLSLVSEKGELVIEDCDLDFPEEILVYNSKNISKHWNCKFYLHNTPHAIAAFLGKKKGLKYLSDAMSDHNIEKIVCSAMNSINLAMKKHKMADPDFIDYYTKREIKRFKDKLLFDPISRVGREPLRKLKSNERLIFVLQFLKEAGCDIFGVCCGIKAAINDLLKERSDLSEETVLMKICKLDSSNELFKKIKCLEIDNLINLKTAPQILA